jgi:Double zinc ribbon
MAQSRRDTYRVLPRSIGKKRAITLLVFAITGIVIALGPSHIPMSGQDRTIPAQTGTSYAAVAANGDLNLTNPSVNASSNFLGSWSSNTTTAQAIINSTDAQRENVTAVWSLDPTPLVSAQIIEYNFEFSTQVPTNGSSGPRITAFVGLASSNYEGWYAQSGTPIFPNNTETVSVANIQGQYSNGSSRTSLVFEAQRVTNAQPAASAGNRTILFQQEFPGYAAGDGVLHNYTIEIDRQSNRTIWIADNTIIATFDLNFVPSSLVFEASAAGPQNLAIATLKDPVQIAVPSVVESITTISSGGQSPSASSPSAGQSSISSLQNQINHLNSQVGNLTSQNSQLQAKTSQWFTQWWAGIIWGSLGAGLGGFLFVSGTRLKTGGKESDGSDEESPCPECGGRMPAGAAFCGECGNVLKETKPVCPECGEQMPAASTFCGDCGTHMTAEDQPSRNLLGSSPSKAPDEKDESWR